MLTIEGVFVGGKKHKFVILVYILVKTSNRTLYIHEYNGV